MLSKTEDKKPSPNAVRSQPDERDPQSVAVENRNPEEGEGEENEIERDPEEGGQVWIGGDPGNEHETQVIQTALGVESSTASIRVTFPRLSDQGHRVRNAAVNFGIGSLSCAPLLFFPELACRQVVRLMTD